MPLKFMPQIGAKAHASGSFAAPKKNLPNEPTDLSISLINIAEFLWVTHGGSPAQERLPLDEKLPNEPTGQPILLTTNINASTQPVPPPRGILN
jgi:hypothetical protein